MAICSDTLPRGVDKAVACVLRTRLGRRELLVFRHPLAGVQIVKGTREPDEAIEAAVLRELEEESGLALTTPPSMIGTWDRIIGSGAKRQGPDEVHRWFIGVLPAPEGLPDQWDHDAVGSIEEDGLRFSFFWIALDPEIFQVLDPHFHPTVEILLAYLEQPPREPT